MKAQNAMRIAHEIRRAAAAQFGGRPGDYVMSIALQMAYEAERNVIMNLEGIKITVKTGIVSPKEVKEDLKKGIDKKNRFYWNERNWWAMPYPGREMELINFALGLGLQVEVWTDRSENTAHPIMAELKQPERRQTVSSYSSRNDWAGCPADLDEADGGYQDYRR